MDGVLLKEPFPGCPACAMLTASRKKSIIFVYNQTESI